MTPRLPVPCLLASAAMAVLAAAASSASAAETKVLPGYWEIVSQYSLLLSQTSTKRECLTAEEVDQYITRPPVKHYTCSYARARVGDGAAAFQGSCFDKHGNSLRLTIRGSYTLEEFHLAANGTLALKGIPLPVSGDFRGHRLSAECPESVSPGK